MDILRLLRILGLPTSAALAFAILLLEVKPLSLDELCERTGYAKSHLSMNLRLLEEKLLTRRILGRGRKVFFTVKKDALKRLLQEHITKLYSNINDVIDELPDETLSEELKVVRDCLSGLIEKLRKR